MSAQNYFISRGAGNVENTTNVQQLAERQLGNSSNWEIRFSPSEWVAIWAKDARVAGDGHVLLLPRSHSLIQDSLTVIGHFINDSGANLSFDPEIGFMYSQVSIVGDANIENGISLDQEKKLRGSRKVERISCRNSEELVTILNERRESGKWFNGV